MSREANAALPRHIQLRAFHAVATERSFTAAAKRLGVSQPALSMHVRALEDAYGVELLARGGRSVAPTALGAALLEITRPMLALEAEAAELLGVAAGLLRGELRVGADAPFVVVPIVAEFRRLHEAVELTLSLGNSTEVLRDLLDGRTDVAALSDRVDDRRLFAVPAAKSRQVIVVAKDHPWAKRSGVKLAELDGAPMLVREEGSATRARFEAAAKRAGVRPRVVMEIGGREALQEAVAAGLGVAAIIDAERARDDRVVALPILDATLEHVEYVVCLQERRRLRIVEAFLEVVGVRGKRR